jgi:uncharacterized membrane protein YqaE (UPF0057 family)
MIDTIETPTRYWLFGILLAVLFPPSVFWYVNKRLEQDEIEHYRKFISLHWLLTLCGWAPGTVVALYYLKRNSKKALKDYDDQMDYQAQSEELRSCLLKVVTEDTSRC